MDPDVIEAIRKRAKELADAAPAFTADQAHLLVTIFGKYPRPDSTAETAT